MARIAYIVLLALALGLGACGGDDEQDGSGGSSGNSAAPADGTSGRAQSDETTTATGADGDPDSDAGGSDGGGSAEGEQPPTRADYVKRADAICSRARHEIGERGDQVAELVQQAQKRKITAQEYYRRTSSLTARSAEIARDAVGELKALPKPDSRREALQRYLDASAEQAQTLGKQAQAQGRGDGDVVGRLNAQLQRTGARTRAAATEFGFHSCGGT
jgi:hypothetical protein